MINTQASNNTLEISLISDNDIKFTPKTNLEISYKNLNPNVTIKF
jgi:hypothetical protein